MEVLVFGHRHYFPGSLTGTNQFISVLPTPAVSAPGAGRFEHRVGQSTTCTCVNVPTGSTGPSCRPLRCSSSEAQERSRGWQATRSRGTSVCPAGEALHVLTQSQQCHAVRPVATNREFLICCCKPCWCCRGRRFVPTRSASLG